MVTFAIPPDGDAILAVSPRWPGPSWRPLANLSLFDRNLLNFHITSTRLLRPARGRIYSHIVYAQIPLRFCLISCSTFSAHDFSWANVLLSDVFWPVCGLPITESKMSEPTDWHVSPEFYEPL